MGMIKKKIGLEIKHTVRIENILRDSQTFACMDNVVLIDAPCSSRHLQRCKQNSVVSLCHMHCTHVFPWRIKCTGIPKLFPKSSVMLIQRNSLQWHGAARTWLSPGRVEAGVGGWLGRRFKVVKCKNDKVDDGGWRRAAPVQNTFHPCFLRELFSRFKCGIGVWVCHGRGSKRRMLLWGVRGPGWGHGFTFWVDQHHCTLKCCSNALVPSALVR